jgi:sugar/nucleoside kinase (ribokinase family)
LAVCVVGSVAYDDVRTPFGEKANILGGAALHFSNVASLLSKVNLIGAVGDDFGKEGFELFKKRGIDASGLEIIKGGKTFHWKGYYEGDMGTAHTISTELGVFAEFNPKIPESFKSSDILFLANIDPALQLRVKKEMGSVFTMLDTMNLWIDIKKDDLLKVIKEIDILLVNEGEAFQLTGEANFINGANKLLELGPKYIVIKKGAYGVSIHGKGLYFALPAYPVTKVVDPTGAGDSFAGGFISYLDNGKEINENTIKNALAYATVMASFYVEGFGIEGLLDIDSDKINKRLEEYKKFISLPPAQ